MVDARAVAVTLSETRAVTDALAGKLVPCIWAPDETPAGVEETAGSPAAAVVAVDVAVSGTVALSVTWSSHEYVFELLSPVAEHVSVAPAAAPEPLFTAH